jgi:hypothetical protein
VTVVNCLDNPDIITPGQRLYLPRVPDEPSRESPTPERSDDPPPPTRVPDRQGDEAEHEESSEDEGGDGRGTR